MLKISPDGRYIVQNDGSPFFYLGDTAWELPYRLDREEADYYLTNRVAKRFNVIQIVALTEYGFELPNRYGHCALVDNDPLTPNEAYFDHLDWLIGRANALGLTVALLPSWGDKWNKAWGKGPEVFTEINAFAFGEWLGRRYCSADLIWVLGGDRHVKTQAHIDIVRAMAAGLSEGDAGSHLRTFHPPGPYSSSQWMHNEEWLDFNMWQTGHDRNVDVYNAMELDYSRTPVKPCLDAEPGYEDHPAGFDPANGYLDEYDVRKAAYGNVFAGACGHTYGCHDIWQFLNTERLPPVSFARTNWRKALDLPGAGQMAHLRALVESRPYFTRIPDQTLLASDALIGGDHIQATRDLHGRYAFVYSASGKPFSVHLTKLSGVDKTLYWYDPRTGVATPAGLCPQRNVKEFYPPTSGHGADWILVIDDAALEFPLPGTATYVGR